MSWYHDFASLAEKIRGCGEVTGLHLCLPTAYTQVMIHRENQDSVTLLLHVLRQHEMYDILEAK